MDWGHFWSNLVFEIRNKFIFRMLCWFLNNLLILKVKKHQRTVGQDFLEIEYMNLNEIRIHVLNVEHFEKVEMKKVFFIVSYKSAIISNLKF